MGISDVKKNLNHRVMYKNAEYILSGCILRYDERRGEYFYQAELRDLRASSIVIARLDEITKV